MYACTAERMERAGGGAISSKVRSGFAAAFSRVAVACKLSPSVEAAANRS